MRGTTVPLAHIAVEQADPSDASVLVLENPGENFFTYWLAEQRAGRCSVFVVRVHERPAGAAVLVWDDPPELQNLFVLESERGQGAGTALIDAAEAAASVRAHSMLIGVGIDNCAARRLYERRGCVGTGEISTTTYDYVDERGACRTATETDEMLVKPLR